MNVAWTFVDYVSPNGKNLIGEWIVREISVQARADFASLLLALAKVRNWSRRDFRPRLEGRPGLSEIKFVSERRQHRLIGCFAPAFTYVLLLGCTHKQQNYDPPNALVTAQERKRKLDLREASTCEHAF